MENRDSIAALSHPFWVGKLSLRLDRRPISPLSDRQPDRGFAEPSTLLPARQRRKSRFGRHLPQVTLVRSTGELVVLGISMVATVCAIVLSTVVRSQAVQKYAHVSIPSVSS